MKEKKKQNQKLTWYKTKEEKEVQQFTLPFPIQQLKGHPPFRQRNKYEWYLPYYPIII